MRYRRGIYGISGYLWDTYGEWSVQVLWSALECMGRAWEQAWGVHGSRHGSRHYSDSCIIAILAPAIEVAILIDGDALGNQGRRPKAWSRCLALAPATLALHCTCQVLAGDVNPNHLIFISLKGA